MTTNQFDPHAIIKKLADAELIPLLNQPYPNDIVVNLATGRTVPFASLRVAIWKVTPESMVLFPSTAEEDKRGWIPEPDVRVACWEISKVLLNDRGEVVVHWWPQDDRWGWQPPSWVLDGTSYEVTTAEEAVLRAAEAWLDEKMKEETP